MSAILEHFTRKGVRTISKWIPPSVVDHLTSDSLKYFNRTFLLAPESFPSSCVDCVHTIRQVITHDIFLFNYCQLIKRALCILLNSPIRKFSASNVLTFGFQKSSTDGEVQNLFPNHLHNFFLTEAWHELHKL